MIWSNFIHQTSINILQFFSHTKMKLLLQTMIMASCFLLASAERCTYIVHMDKSLMPKAFSTHHHWYSSLLNSANSDKLQPKHIYTYHNAFHGFAALMSETQMAALKKSTGFLSAYVDDLVTPDTTHSYEFLSLNTATGLWPAGQYGKDVIIGVIDSGIWPESRSFRDDGMTEIPARWKGICQVGDEFNSSSCNKKLIGARYFNQGSRAANPDVNITMNSARDLSGHGTHVASTAAGNYVDGVSFFGYAPGTARGVAPRARIAAYKVLGWDGGDYESDALAGIDQAVADGVDILSISLSYRRTTFYENPLAVAGFGAREKGILMSVSAGNRGPNYGTLREGIPWALVVGAGTLDRWLAGTLTLGNGDTIKGWTVFPAKAIVRSLPLVYNQTFPKCNTSELIEQAPQDTIIVCNITREDEYSFSSIVDHLLSPNARARAAIIISDATNIQRSLSFVFPVVVITPSEGDQLIDYLTNSNNNQPTASIDFQRTYLGVSDPISAPALADFSSRGPDLSYPRFVKPDIMAPGVLILAADYPYLVRTRISNNIFLATDYRVRSGTSMACPHISGIAALLKSAHPDWSAAAIQSAMMTTASQTDNSNQAIKDLDNYGDGILRDATPLGMGAGQVDPNRALDPGLVYDANIQDYVNLVCSMNLTHEQTRTIIRSSYNCSNPSSDLNYPSFMVVYDYRETRSTLTQSFKRTVTNVGDGAATYRVEVEAPRNSSIMVSPQTLVFGKKSEKRSYTLSIQHRTGDYPRYGSLCWIELKGKYRVTSPIVVVSATLVNE